MEDEGLARLPQPDDRPGLEPEGAVLDGGPVGIGLVAPLRAAGCLQGRVDPRQGLALRDRHEIVRPVEERHREGVRPLPRSLEFRLVIAGEETRTGFWNDLEGRETGLEEAPRPIRRGVGLGQGRPAGLAQPGLGGQSRAQRGRAVAESRAAAPKGPQGGGVIVVGPARQVREGEGFEIGRSGGCGTVVRSSAAAPAHRTSAASPAPLIAPLRSRRAASWDCGCPGSARRSRRR